MPAASPSDRRQQRSAPGTVLPVNDDEAFVGDGALDGLDACGRYLERLDRRPAARESRDAIELGIERELAVDEREHAPRDANRLALFRGVAGIGALHQEQSAQSSLRPELAPGLERWRRAVDESTQRIE